MNNNNNKSGNNFFNGFLLGLLVGAAIVFLLGTKKGKRLLKAISEEGIENISNILEKTDKSVDLDEIINEEQEEALEAEMPEKRGENIERTVRKPVAKRFFRGIPRRLTN